MKVLFDTSVLVPAMYRQHANNGLALPWLGKAMAGKIQMYVSSHSLAEVYGVLTALPCRPRMSPRVARQIISDNLDKHAKIVALNTGDYMHCLDAAAASGVSGGTIYDLLVIQAARKSHADKILTFNTSVFLRIWPEGRDIIAKP